VDGADIKEDIKVESGDDQRTEDIPMEGCVPLPGVDEADIKDDINDESVAKDGFSSHALLAGVDEMAIQDEADIKDDIKVESNVNDQSCLKKDFKERFASDKDDDDQGDDQRMRDNLMGKSILLPGVKSHYGEENEDGLDTHAEQILRKDVLLAGVEDSRNDETKQEKDELVSRKDDALTPEVEREDLEPEIRNPTDDVKSVSKVCPSTNHIGSHKAEALKDMGNARVATGRVPILSASVKKPDKENWKTNSTSQFEAMLTLGKGQATTSYATRSKPKRIWARQGRQLVRAGSDKPS
jgi:hypothetical protein